MMNLASADVLMKWEERVFAERVVGRRLWEQSGCYEVREIKGLLSSKSPWMSKSHVFLQELLHLQKVDFGPKMSFGIEMVSTFLKYSLARSWLRGVRYLFPQSKLVMEL